MKNTDRYLNEDALRYLGMKVLNLDSVDDLDNKPGQSPYLNLLLNISKLAQLS